MNVMQKAEVVRNYFRLLQDQGLSKAPTGFLRQHHNTMVATKSINAEQIIAGACSNSEALLSDSGNKRR